MSFATATVVGNVTKDIEVSVGQSGTEVANYTLAVNKRTGKGDNKKETVTFINAVSFGQQALTLADHVKKGSILAVQGELEDSVWKDKETGKDRRATKLVVSRFWFMSGGKKEGGGETRSVCGIPVGGQAKHLPDVNSEEIPF